MLRALSLPPKPVNSGALSICGPASLGPDKRQGLVIARAHSGNRNANATCERDLIVMGRKQNGKQVAEKGRLSAGAGQRTNQIMGASR